MVTFAVDVAAHVPAAQVEVAEATMVTGPAGTKGGAVYTAPVPLAVWYGAT